MKNLYTFVFWLLVPALCLAQTPCPLYQKYMDKGNAAVTAERFEEAINAFSAAMLHCPDQADESQQKIIEVFNRINQLKIDAQNALKKADSAIAEIARRELASARAELDKVRPQTAFGYLKNADFSKDPQVRAGMLPLMAEIAFLELHQSPLKEWPKLPSFQTFGMSEGKITLDFKQKGTLFAQALREAQSFPNKSQARAHVLSTMEQKLGKAVIQAIRDRYYPTKIYTD